MAREVLGESRWVLIKLRSDLFHGQMCLAQQPGRASESHFSGKLPHCYAAVAAKQRSKSVLRQVTPLRQRANSPTLARRSLDQPSDFRNSVVHTVDVRTMDDLFSDPDCAQEFE